MEWYVYEVIVDYIHVLMFNISCWVYVLTMKKKVILVDTFAIFGEALKLLEEQVVGLVKQIKVCEVGIDKAQEYVLWHQNAHQCLSKCFQTFGRGKQNIGKQIHHLFIQKSKLTNNADYQIKPLQNKHYTKPYERKKAQGEQKLTLLKT